jgi:EAL domain-containing protein (putative c-di-GMP-specific phosphodiesterase class I)
VGPAEFIGLAEDVGLIGAIGERVLQLACAQFARWRGSWGEAGPGILSVNLSRGQLDEPGLVGQVQRSLQDSGLPAACLQLELTESMAGQDTVLQSHLPALKALGLTLALDDFGTGYSSLACLHQLPMDVVKIDRSFVSQAETSDHHRVLIDATVRVARSLGMGTVAEGIETPGQARLLQTLGCDKGQGYVFARPLTAAQVQTWWGERQMVGQT